MYTSSFCMFYFYFVCLFVLYSALIWIHDYALNKNRCYYYYIIANQTKPELASVGYGLRAFIMVWIRQCTYGLE